MQLHKDIFFIENRSTSENFKTGVSVTPSHLENAPINVYLKHVVDIWLKKVLRGDLSVLTATKKAYSGVQRL